MGETGRPAQVRLDMQHLFLGLERHIFNLDRDVIDLELLRPKVAAPGAARGRRHLPQAPRGDRSSRRDPR